MDAGMVTGLALCFEDGEIDNSFVKLLANTDVNFGATNPIMVVGKYNFNANAITQHVTVLTNVQTCVLQK